MLFFSVNVLLETSCCFVCVVRGCEAFRKSCLLAQEPEDVTVGLVVGKGKYMNE